MPHPDDAWAELRAFASCRPSRLAFRALASLLDTWPGDDFPRAFACAEELLESWPDEERAAPWAWAQALVQGREVPSWPLARTVALRSRHLTKGAVGLARLAAQAEVGQLTELTPTGRGDLVYLYHRPERFPALRRLTAVDAIGQLDLAALADKPFWGQLERFGIQPLDDDLLHFGASRVVPRVTEDNRLRSVRLRAEDLIAVWERGPLPRQRRAEVFIRSVEEAEALAARPELAGLGELGLAFRCGFNGTTPGEPFVGNVIEDDERAARAFFARARLDALEELSLVGYTQGYWGRGGLGPAGLEALLASGVPARLKSLELAHLPLGDAGVAALAPHLPAGLERLALRDVYCKGDGARALADSACLAGLRRLDLSGNRIDAEACAALAAVDMPQLEELDLSGPSIQPYYFDLGHQPLLDAGVAAWMERPRPRLQTLRLANVFLGDAGAAAVFGARLPALHSLDLSHAQLSAEGVARFLGSALWDSLETLELHECRLDDAALEALVRQESAPQLRRLGLAHNAIGPAGAQALAGWPVLAGLWSLDLHDNAIGDAGLVALARSPHPVRLLELDLEQDCWNRRRFDFADATAEALAEPVALRRLEGLFTGCIDAYHGAAYSPGFSKDALRRLLRAEAFRPTVRAACASWTEIDEYVRTGPWDPAAERSDSDFRAEPRALSTAESRPCGGEVRQPSGRPAWAQVTELPGLATLDDAPLAPDVLHGIEHRRPVPTGMHAHLQLDHQDPRQPLPPPAGKYLADALDAFLRAEERGSCEVGGSSSVLLDDGTTECTASTFYLTLTEPVSPAVEGIREALWWGRAPASSALEKYDDSFDDEDDGDEEEADELALRLDAAPPAGSRWLQLARLEVAHWGPEERRSFRLDRVPFPQPLRERLAELLAPGRPDGEQIAIEPKEGGALRIYRRGLAADPAFDTLLVEIAEAGPGVAAFVFRLMRAGNLLLLPAGITASAALAEDFDAAWPVLTVVEDAAALGEILDAGPRAWWERGKHAS